MQKNLAYVPTRSTPGKLAEISQDELLDRLANGESPSQLAAQYSVSRPAIYFRLRDHPEYQICRELGMDGNLDRKLDDVMASADLPSARMEEVKLRRLEWRAEREFPHRWGQKQQVTVTTEPVFVIHVSGDPGNVLEATDAEDVEILPHVNSPT